MIRTRSACQATRRPHVNYRVTLGCARVELTAEEARRMWDAWPEDQRTGEREAAFILWDLNGLGCRCSPMLCRPITSATHR
jgi:hypothetical protein